MGSSLLGLFRGTDGRSLARALACLILVNALFAGLHNGAVAAGVGTAICSLGHDRGSGGTPGDEQNAPCCSAGCTLSAAALINPPEAALAAPIWRFIGAAAIAAASGPAASTRTFDHGPRGPPSLA